MVLRNKKNDKEIKILNENIKIAKNPVNEFLKDELFMHSNKNSYINHFNHERNWNGHAYIFFHLKRANSCVLVSIVKVG